jgi:hypothetical protein
MLVLAARCSCTFNLSSPAACPSMVLVERLTAYQFGLRSPPAPDKN